MRHVSLGTVGTSHPGRSHGPETAAGTRTLCHGLFEVPGPSPHTLLPPVPGGGRGPRNVLPEPLTSSPLCQPSKVVIFTLSRSATSLQEGRRPRRDFLRRNRMFWNTVTTWKGECVPHSAGGREPTPGQGAWPHRACEWLLWWKLLEGFRGSQHPEALGWAPASDAVVLGPPQPRAEGVL